MPYKDKPRKISGTNWIIRCVNRPNPPISVFERFKDKYKVMESGCWEWHGGLSDTGYGAFRAVGKNESAHRFSYQMFIGEIENNLRVCHKCDNKKCVSPFHFFLGTDAENLKDARDKGIMRVSKCPSRNNYNYGCRCEGCKEVSRQHHRDRRRIKKLDNLISKNK